MPLMNNTHSLGTKSQAKCCRVRRKKRKILYCRDYNGILKNTICISITLWLAQIFSQPLNYGNRSRMGWRGWICRADVHRVVLRSLGQVFTVYNTWKKRWVSTHIHLSGGCSAGGVFGGQVNCIANDMWPSTLELRGIDFMTMLIGWWHYTNEYSPEHWCEKLQRGQNITIFCPLKMCHIGKII